MTETSHDVIVAGLGGMGSAAAWHLARRGQRVLGIEQFGVAHDRGSSHGATRIIRQAYFEDPAYVPLLLRSYELWDDLTGRAGHPMIHRTGGLMIGAPASTAVVGALASARAFDLPHELLDSAQVRRRFPTLSPETDEVAFFETNAGWVRPEDTVRVHLELARSAGAELLFDTPVLDWDVTGDGVVVSTQGGSTEPSVSSSPPGRGRPSSCSGSGSPWPWNARSSTGTPRQRGSARSPTTRYTSGRTPTGCSSTASPLSTAPRAGRRWPSSVVDAPPTPMTWTRRCPRRRSRR